MLRFLSWSRYNYDYAARSVEVLWNTRKWCYVAGATNSINYSRRSCKTRTKATTNCESRPTDEPMLTYTVNESSALGHDNNNNRSEVVLAPDNLTFHPLRARNRIEAFRECYLRWGVSWLPNRWDTYFWQSETLKSKMEKIPRPFRHSQSLPHSWFMTSHTTIVFI